MVLLQKRDAGTRPAAERVVCSGVHLAISGRKWLRSSVRMVHCAKFSLSAENAAPNEATRWGLHFLRARLAVPLDR